MTDQEKVNVYTLNWGPCIIKLKVIDEFKKLLLKEAKEDTIDFRTKLAGIIEKERGYSAESIEKVVPYMPEYILSALWINYQKANEFNPPHDHDGKLSFVVYLKIPDELKKEHAAYKGKSCGPGGVQFIYGDGPRDCVTYQSFFPEEGDMFIFPAWLKHWVAPFKSDCVRISVSGNVHDSAPLNNIVNFAPQYLKKK